MEFGEYLPRVLKHLHGLDNYEKKFKKDVKRILQIWEDKGIYNGDLMVKLKNILGIASCWNIDGHVQNKHKLWKSQDFFDNRL